MTQTETTANKGEVERVASGVPGLDAVLYGGFLRGGLYLVQGPPGMGKTILANQILYGQAAEGGRALFVTVLSENHGRMMAHLRPMRFFDETLIPEQVAYISAYRALEDDGLKGLANLIRREVMARRAGLLVIDGMSAVQAAVGAELDIKRFTHELQTMASSTNCTMFLLTSAVGAMSAPEHTMVDGLIELRQQFHGARSERRITVHKLRGGRYLEGARVPHHLGRHHGVPADRSPLRSAHVPWPPAWDAAVDRGRLARRHVQWRHSRGLHDRAGRSVRRGQDHASALSAIK